jgi:hypothetical protein
LKGALFSSLIGRQLGKKRCTHVTLPRRPDEFPASLLRDRNQHSRGIKIEWRRRSNTAASRVARSLAGYWRCPKSVKSKRSFANHAADNAAAMIDGTDKMAIAVRSEAHLRSFMCDLRGCVSDVGSISSENGGFTSAA